MMVMVAEETDGDGTTNFTMFVVSFGTDVFGEGYVFGLHLLFA